MSRSYSSGHLTSSICTLSYPLQDTENFQSPSINDSVVLLLVGFLWNIPKNIWDWNEVEMVTLSWVDTIADIYNKPWEVS
jgi:hypothetical protein